MRGDDQRDALGGISDRISRKEVARMLGTSRQAISELDRQGKLVPFEHGLVGGPYRRFSRMLVRRYLHYCRDRAFETQDQFLAADLVTDNNRNLGHESHT